jgi:pimeloyl-ACP methyl ester carboxylesterase
VHRASGRLPVLLFSHGWEGFAAQNTGQALQLASHGYVVIAVQHSYGAVLTVFADGSSAPLDAAALPENAPVAEYDADAARISAQWTADLAFVLDFFTAQDRAGSGPFAGVLDLEKVGVIGHSFGGGTSLRFAATDARVKAVFGEDPYIRVIPPDVIARGVTQPSYIMFSQDWTDDAKSRNNELYAALAPGLRGSLGVVHVKGTGHYDFSDLPRLTPLAHRIGLKGPIPGKRVAAILDEALLAFFDATLRGGSTTLFAGAPPWPEVVPRAR